ncbi:gas vesicle protein GvpO [Saccharopolyspora mangrovi]|uniref:Gas vesicle protein GvpO n=1 Tax=Saccharopolyspora mangrovi TaxID=3082379 RepID=A0ABU6ACK2_9PSEU|nr:gas vesicle protein GvpO [Saccharopolyspora sp. S2-29]MEB3369197.1 gas vesicle protein GvpO [Saccharopolyspora sp. S2-29]
MDGDARDEAKSRGDRPGQRRASERTEPRRRREAEQEDARPARERAPQLEAAEAAKLAVDHVTALTGRDPEGVTSLEPTDDGWLVGVEVVESRRVPDSTDVMAVYEAAVDHGGRLVSYRRVDRYARGRGNER